MKKVFLLTNTVGVALVSVIMVKFEELSTSISYNIKTQSRKLQSIK